MRETTEATIEILEDLFSNTGHGAWRGSCAICSLLFNHARVMEFLPYRAQIRHATDDVDMGGLIGSNRRFLDKAFEIMDFHERNEACPCALLGEDSNPKYLKADGYVTIEKTVYEESPGFTNRVNYYIVCCKGCAARYKVEELEYHFPWWNWIALRE